MSETLAGFRFLFRENEGVLAFLTLAVVSLSMVGGAFWTLTVVLAEEAYGLGGEGAGFLNAAYGAGGLLGGFAAGLLSSRVRLAPAFIWSAVASSLLFLFLGLSPAGLLPFVVLVIVGAIDIVADVNGTTILQTATPDDLLGRVFGAFEATLISSMLVGALVVGLLIDAIGVRGAKSRPRISSTSLSRPTSGVGCMGRLFGRLSSVLRSGKSAGRSGARSSKTRSGRARSLRRCSPRSRSSVSTGS
jgi:MFS family permease